MNLKHSSKKLIALNWIVLVILHFTILGSAYLNLKSFYTPFIFTLAIVQMILVILFFMEVRWSKKLIWVFVAPGFFWFLFFVTLTFCDYLTRQWH